MSVLFLAFLVLLLFHFYHEIALVIDVDFEILFRHARGGKLEVVVVLIF